jgi:hypothetical protein
MSQTFEIVQKIVNKADRKLRIETEDERIVITAPAKEGRWGMEPLFWLSVLNNDDWYKVPKDTKIRVRGFGCGIDEKNHLKWMKDWFGDNFEITNIPI